ncbi:MAG: hypothetical protein AAB254_04250, partial [candidate division NC10 bacterium]
AGHAAAYLDLGLHISIGVVLNILGTLVMVLMNGVGSFMLTPPDNPGTATVWQSLNNATWTGLNLHRFVANISFGKFESRHSKTTTPRMFLPASMSA